MSPMPSVPTVAVLMTQPQCNMFCTFCITEDDFGVIGFERAVELLEEIRAAGTKNVVLGGGEPFCWPHDLVKLASRAKALGFTVQVATNAIALPRGFARLEEIDRYVLPLESADPGPHNALRRYRNQHHAIVLSALDELAVAGKSVTISTVATARNIDGVTPLADWLAEYNARSGNVHAWHIYRFLPQGRGGLSFADELGISGDAYDSMFAKVRERGLPFRVYRRADMCQTQSVAFFCERDGALVRS